MKRALLTLALLATPALMVTATAQGTTVTDPTTGAQKTIEAITATSEKGYSIRVPGGWTPLKNAPGTDVAFIYQKVGDLRPTVTVVVQDIPAELKATLADVRDLNARKMPDVVPKLKMLGEKTTKVSGTPAILWTYTGDGDGGTVRWTQVFTLKNNRLYTATLMTPNGTPSSVISEGRAILNSLTLK
ncbi:PsbP-related protein [Deinococcus aquaticus]|uniref:PsbP-related protein n=1 Tax=Deinococcus aquaticus TaxID=328692 RepID=UPI003F46E534